MTEQPGVYHDPYDQDGGEFSIHHTLGTDVFQAAAGNHKHADIAASITALSKGKVALSVWAPGVDPATAFTAVTDVTGLAAITWTPDSTRMYRLSVFGLTSQITNAANQSLYITDNSNNVVMQTNQTAPVGAFLSWNMVYYLSGVGVSLTHKVRVLSGAASGTMRALTTYPWYFLIEDIGLA